MPSSVHCIPLADWPGALKSCSIFPAGRLGYPDFGEAGVFAWPDSAIDGHAAAAPMPPAVAAARLNHSRRLMAVMRSLLVSEASWPRSAIQLFSERARSQLEVRRQRTRALPAFNQPRRAIAVRRPDSATLPSGARIVDAAVEPLGVEPDRI